MKCRKSGAGLFWGIVLVLLGIGFFLGSANILNFNHLLANWWPAIFVIFALFKLFEGRPMSAMTWAFIGFALLVATTGVIQANFWQVFWPLILILIGLKILFHSHHHEQADTSDYADAFSIFGGSEKKAESQNFKNASLVSIFGGSKLDLRKSKLAETGGVVDVLVVFGGGEITVPKGMPVKIDTVAIFGGNDDKRTDAASIDGKPYLHIQGLIVFGGLEAKD